MDGWMKAGREGGREAGMSGGMDGWMDGWMDEWTDGWIRWMEALQSHELQCMLISDAPCA